MKRNLPLILLCIGFLGIAAFSGYQLFNILSEYKVGEDTYKDLEQYISTTTPAPDDESEVENDGTVWPEVDFDALKAINEDIVGWIYIEDTNVNYPIVQGEDNDYYLHRLYDGTANGSGSIFMDFRNSSDFSDPHTIIYGHSMQNSSMFTNIKKYKTQEFYDQHPFALLMTPEKNYKVELFSGYVANVKDTSWDLDFGDAAVFQSWLSATKSKSMFLSDSAPTTDDKILTMSTCTYEFDNARFVLVGILREQ